MEQQPKNFLALIRHGLHQTSAELTDPDWNEIYELSKLHNMVPLIYESARSLSEFADAGPEIQNAFLQTTLYQAGIQMTRTEEFFRLYELFSQSGLRPLVLKGLVCRSLYPQPELRGSADEDLWIRPEDLDTYDAVLTDQGYHCEDPDPDLNTIQEVTYASPLLELELHINPFGTTTASRRQMNQVLADPAEHSMAMELDGHTIFTLAPTNHYLFLFVHLYKHFTGSGVGIRQILDLMLFEQAYSAQIDWDRIHTAVSRLGTEVLYAAVLEIGRDYLGFSLRQPVGPLQFPDSDALDALTEDLLESGCFGNSALYQRFSKIYVYARSEGTEFPGEKLLLLLFPPASLLKTKYPFLNRKPWLLPAAWCMRVFRFLRDLSKDHSLIKHSTKRGLKRLKLIKKLTVKNDPKTP